MRKSTFTFNDEIPLVIENGFEAAEVEIIAEISYNHGGEWGIENIAFDSRKRISHTLEDYTRARVTGRLPDPFFRKSITLDATSPLHSIIYHRLENEWYFRVQEAVMEQIAHDREAAADDAADARRDERRGL